MRPPRELGPPPERTFAELFPWRNVTRALMLVGLILAIVVVKRSAGGFLQRVTNLVAPPSPSAALAPAPRLPVAGGATIRLGPGLAPAAGAAGPSSR